MDLCKEVAVQIGVAPNRQKLLHGSKILNPILGIAQEGVQDNDTLMLILAEPGVTIKANRLAFAAVRTDGSVVTWGDPDYGGDSTGVQEELKGVQQIQGTYLGFA